MFKVNNNDTRKMPIDTLLLSLLLTLDIFYTLFLLLTLNRQVSAGRYVVLFDINRVCMRFVNLYDLLCMDLCFITIIPIFVYAKFHGFVLMLCLIFDTVMTKSSKDVFLTL